MAAHKVTLKLPDGKKNYTITFRHPVVKDAEGKNGRKVHRGLRTDDESQARGLAEQLETLLNRPEWWDISKRELAEQKFDARIAAAFYDCMDPQKGDAMDLLDKIPLPTRAEGYTDIVLLGQTGAAKTTLLRKLLGTERDAFPTTSTNRTTTAEWDIILHEGETYELAVLFLSRSEIEMAVQECVEQAVQFCRSSGENDREKIAQKLLNHEDLTLRLPYILGDLSLRDPASVEKGEPDDEDDEEDEEEEDLLPYESHPYRCNQNVEDLKQVLNSLLDDVQALAAACGETPDFRETDGFYDIVNRIMEEIAKRFSLLRGGKKLESHGDWVRGWYFATDRYTTFLRTAKMFSSDNKNAWGSLLTPLVSAVRIQGKFQASWRADMPKYILHDGVGLGHKMGTASASAIPTETVKRCNQADAVLLVDPANNAILHETQLAIRSLIDTGNIRKTILCFTKMDLVKGASFANSRDKKRHISAALTSYLSTLGKEAPGILSEAEKESLLNSCFYFAHLDRNVVKEKAKETFFHLSAKIQACFQRRSEEKPDPEPLTYSALQLYYYFYDAIAEFRTTWSRKIGYPSKSDQTEHWSRIRALTRRLASSERDHYDSLQPLADYAASMQRQFRAFIHKPLQIPADNSRDLFDILKRSFSMAFLQWNEAHMWKEKAVLQKWRTAYHFCGEGSAYWRAKEIDSIFQETAPCPEDSAKPTPEQFAYLRELIQLAETVLQENGCKLENKEWMETIVSD